MDSYSILVVIISVLMIIMLVLSIVALIFIIKAAKNVKNITNTASQTVESVKSAVVNFELASGPLGAGKFVLDALGKLTSNKKSKKSKK
jgi:biopolymer transport protein ExbB/TolQ